MDIQIVIDVFVTRLLPLLTWGALIYLLLRWAFQRWEIHLAGKRALSLKFPVSPMVYLSRKILVEELVSDSQVQTAINEFAAESGEHASDIEKTVRRYGFEIVPAFKAVFYFSIGYGLAKLLLLTFYRTRMVENAGENYERVGRDATVVLFMNHRSNMDVLLVNYLLSNQSTVSHAAGEWARLWPLHHLVRLAGNYVVDREADDPLYRLVLKRYVQMAVSQGIHLGIFPEGGLTRDGQIQPLQFGLLNYVATANWPGHDRDVVFIPVAFNYDKIPEQLGLVFGDKQQYRARGKLYLAYSSMMFCLKLLTLMVTPRNKRFGWACASFGEPVSLKSWQRSRGIDLKTLSKKRQRQHINALGNQLMGEVRQIMPVLPIHLLALALLEDESKVWPQSELFQRAGKLRLAVESATAPVFSYEVSETQAYQQALDMLQDMGVVQCTPDQKNDQRVVVAPEQTDMLRYYTNSISHYLKPEDSARMAEFTPVSSAHADQAAKNHLAIFMQSLQRVQEQIIDGEGFIGHFYRLFMGASPDIAQKFSNTDMARQHLHLQQSLEHMQDFFVSGKPSERLRRIAASHSESGKNIPHEMYVLWLQSLLVAVKQYDDQHDARIELSWRTVMLPGIDYMSSQYDSAEQSSDSMESIESMHSGAELPDIETLPSIEKQGIARWVEHWSQRDPDKVALRGADRTFSYSELEKEVNQLAAGMSQKLGVGNGDRVAYLAQNRPEFIVLLFACARLGAILVPINFRLVPVEQQRLIERAEIKVLFLESARLNAMQGDSKGYRYVVLDNQVHGNADFGYHDLLVDEAFVAKNVVDNPGQMDSPLLLVFTSGSTGDPKGVVLNQSAVHWNALNSRVMHDMQRSDHIVTTLPFFHVGGINIQTLPALHLGATVSIIAEFDPAQFAAFVESQRPTLTVLVPAQMQQLMALPNWNIINMTSLRAVSTGSTLVNKNLIRSWANKGIPVIQIYGCTESGPIAVHQTVEGIGPGLGSVGHPALYTQVRIADEDGRALATGSEGEILLRGPNIMSHYWRDKEATSQALRDGWLSTGDLGYLDKNQRLYIVGRKKRLIISGGENIHPAEIEQVLEQHPDISEAAVVGITNSKWGEVPVAVLSVRAGAELTEQTIRDYLAQHLGRYKHPRHILMAGEIPHTALGKIAYAEVSELVKREKME